VSWFRLPKFGPFSRQRTGKDLTAGLTTALVTIPDGLASQCWPTQSGARLYALMVATPIAALAMSSQLMYVANTVRSRSPPVGRSPATRARPLVSALIVLTFLVGAIQLALGLLRARCDHPLRVERSDDRFMTGIMVRIILGSSASSAATAPRPATRCCRRGNYCLTLRRCMARRWRSASARSR